MVPCSPLLSEPSNGKWLFKWQVMHRLLIPSPGPQSWQGRLGKCLCWWGFVVRYGKIKGWHGRIRQLVFVASCHPGSIAVALRSLGAGYCGQPVLWRSPWVLRCSEPLADHFATATNGVEMMWSAPRAFDRKVLGEVQTCIIIAYYSNFLE